MMESGRAAVVILGAGKPFRGESPSALVETTARRRVLDWILESFRGVTDPEFHFVGGYRANEVIQRYPGISFSTNPRWQITGSLGSLLAAPLRGDTTTYVCYADVVFTDAVVARMRAVEADVVIGVDRRWKERYPSRTEEDLLSAEKVSLREGKVVAVGARLSVWEADGEYTGLLRLSPRAVEQTLALRQRLGESLEREGIPHLIQLLLDTDLRVGIAEVEGQWAELNHPQDLARFVLGTKAETLQRLRRLVRKGVICEQVSFTVGEWRADRESILAQLQTELGGRPLAVRSSSAAEDGWTHSNAGRFQSLLDVPGSDPQRVSEAVESVAASYADLLPGDQVLVQPMLHEVVMSGVVCTRALGSAGPYYVVNYDEATARTDSVTRGSGQQLETVVVHRGDAPSAEFPAQLRDVLEAVRELEELIGHDALDIEFAVTTDGRVHILQVRPLTLARGDRELDAAVENALHQAGGFFLRTQKALPHVLGERTFFGVMPDWNPAEIIGRRPHRLALTLYEHLIMDAVWARQRAEYGYRDVRPHPLMVSLAGQPYVDVRATFNSFVPAALDRALAARLVNHYLRRLERRPQLHDKVEFEILFTCLTFDFDRLAAERLRGDGFEPQEVEALRDALREITAGAMQRPARDLARLGILEERLAGTLACGADPIEKAYMLIEDCRRYGTLPFAHLARSAFVAVALLRSLERVGITTPRQTEAFLGSVNTVARQFEQDGARVASGALEWEEFVNRYGHLRPGTYEVLSPSYREDPERFLRPMVRGAEAPAPAMPAPWEERTRTSIGEALRRSGLPDEVEHFEAFLRQAIAGREYAKFAFTRALSAALDELRRFAAGHGLTREQLSHLRLGDILSLRTGSSVQEARLWLAERAEKGRAAHRVSQAVELPPLIFRPEDIYAFKLPPTQPNFITGANAVAEIAVLDGSMPGGVALDGKIVLIEQADPGFDWLFGHGLAGLITLYGGANSHMAIRAAELGLPAAIGVGEGLFERLTGARLLELDCGRRTVRVLA